MLKLFYTSLPFHLCLFLVMFSLLRWSPYWWEQGEILKVDPMVAAMRF